jgi:hypothetical protein
MAGRILDVPWRSNGKVTIDRQAVPAKTSICKLRARASGVADRRP